MTIIVTGGSGLVGNALKKILPTAHYPTRNDVNLLNQKETMQWFRTFSPTQVIHLAAKVGGVQANMNQPASFAVENMTINTNLLEACYQAGTKKVVSMLSSCVYPDSPYVVYPLTENQLHLGPPHFTNYGYAYAKRMLEVQSRAYRQQYGCVFTTVIPNNLFGPHDNYRTEDSHVIPAIIRKVWEAKQANAPFIEVWGDGSPLREFTYSEDIAKILVWLLENYDGVEPLNIGSTIEVSIKDVVEKVCEYFGYDGKIKWNTAKPSGQYRKPTSNQNLLNLGWNASNYTPFNDALKRSCDWFGSNHTTARK